MLFCVHQACSTLVFLRAPQFLLVNLLLVVVKLIHEPVHLVLVITHVNQSTDTLQLPFHVREFLMVHIDTNIDRHFIIRIHSRHHHIVVMWVLQNITRHVMIHGRSDALVTVTLKVGVRVFTHECAAVPRAEKATIVPAQMRHLYVLVKCVSCSCHGHDTFF